MHFSFDVLHALMMLIGIAGDAVRHVACGGDGIVCL